MMKKFTKWMAFALVLTLIVALTGCANSKDADTLTGTWKYTMDFSKAMAAAGDAEEMEGLEELGDSFKEMLNGLTMVMVLELKEDQTYSFYIDEDSAKAAVETMMSKMSELMPKLVAEMTGMSEEDVVKTLESEGKSMDDMLKEYAGEMNTDEMLKDLKESASKGTYRFSDGKLYLTEEGEVENPADYAVVELEGNELRITEVSEGAQFDEYKSLLPLVFVR